jgi:hypothetical protein
VVGGAQHGAFHRALRRAQRSALGESPSGDGGWTDG